LINFIEFVYVDITICSRDTGSLWYL